MELGGGGGGGGGGGEDGESTYKGGIGGAKLGGTRLGGGLGGETRLGGQSLLGRPSAFSSKNNGQNSSHSNSLSNNSSHSNNSFSNSRISLGINSCQNPMVGFGHPTSTPSTPFASTSSSLLQQQLGGFGGTSQAPNANGDTCSNTSINYHSNGNSNYNGGSSYSSSSSGNSGISDSSSYSCNSRNNFGTFSSGNHSNTILQSSPSHSSYGGGLQRSSNSSSIPMNNNYSNNKNNFNSNNATGFFSLPPIATDTFPPTNLSSSASSMAASISITTTMSSSLSLSSSSSSSSSSAPPSCSRRVPKAEISRKPYNQRRDKIMKESLDKLKKDRRKYMNELRTMRTSHAEFQTGNNGSNGGSGEFDVSFGEMGASGRLASSILRSVVRELDTEGSYLFHDDESGGGLDEGEDEFYNSEDYQDLQIKLSLEIEKELKYTDEGDYFDEEEGSFEAQRLGELLEIESFAQSSESCSVLDNPNYLICPFCRLSSMDFDEGSPIMMCSSCLVELNYSAWGSVANLSNSLGDVFDSHHRYCSSSCISSSASASASESVGNYGGGGSCLESTMQLSDASHQNKPSSTLDRIQIFSQNEGRDLYAMCQFCGFSGKVST